MPVAAMTYTTLLEDVEKYMERTDDVKLLAQLPRLLMVAENKLAAKLKTMGIQMVLNSALTAANAVLAKPTYWRNTLSFHIQLETGERKALFLRAYEFCVAYWPIRTNVAVPRYYADYNYENFLLAPTPTEGLAIELLYYPRLMPLSDERQVNWFTTTAPQLLLAAVMHEAFIWAKNAEKAALWQGMRDEALEDLVKEDNVRVTDRTAVIR